MHGIALRCWLLENAVDTAAGLAWRHHVMIELFSISSL
jgi:hypothetical protein